LLRNELRNKTNPLSLLAVIKHFLSKIFSHNTLINFFTRFLKLHDRRRQLMPKPLLLGDPFERRKFGFIILTLQQVSQKQNIKKKLCCLN